MSNTELISYKGLSPASKKASLAGKGASKKSGTKPELLLRKALWKAGLRYRKCINYLPGKPDIVFIGPRLAIFCDGDFWHGKDWIFRKKKLKNGSNPNYWIAKIERNIERDKYNNEKLKHNGWKVLRFWESEISNDLDNVVLKINNILNTKKS